MSNQLAGVSIGDTFYGYYNHFLLSLGGVSKLVYVLVTNLIMIAGIVLLFIMVYAGFSMVSAAGEPQAYEKARNMLTNGIMGFIIVIAAWFLVRVVETSTGVSILQ